MERSRRHKRRKQDGESRKKRQKQTEEEPKPQEEEKVEEVKTPVTEEAAHEEPTEKPKESQQEPAKGETQAPSTSMDSNQVEDQSKTPVLDDALENDQSVPSTQAEPEVANQLEPSTQAEPEVADQSEPSTQAEPEVVDQSEPSTEEREEDTERKQNEDDDTCTVVFSVHRTGNLESFFEQLPEEKKTEFEEKAALMIKTVEDVIEAGGSPPKDGKITANASFKLQISDTKHVFAVLRSGISADEPLNAQNDICIVTQFNPTHWSAEFASNLEDAVPTSDVPIYWMSYKAGKRFKWTESPTAILHGHSMYTKEMAHKVRFPITPEPILASTPLDTQSVLDLYEGNSYPLTKIFIREGHGFLLLAASLQKAGEEFEATIVPNL